MRNATRCIAIMAVLVLLSLIPIPSGVAGKLDPAVEKALRYSQQGSSSPLAFIGGAKALPSSAQQEETTPPPPPYRYIPYWYYASGIGPGNYETRPMLKVSLNQAFFQNFVDANGVPLPRSPLAVKVTLFPRGGPTQVSFLTTVQPGPVTSIDLSSYVSPYKRTNTTGDGEWGKGLRVGSVWGSATIELAQPQTDDPGRLREVDATIDSTSSVESLSVVSHGTWGAEQKTGVTIWTPSASTTALLVLRDRRAAGPATVTLNGGSAPLQAFDGDRFLTTTSLDTNQYRLWKLSGIPVGVNHVTVTGSAGADLMGHIMVLDPAAGMSYTQELRVKGGSAVGSDLIVTKATPTGDNTGAGGGEIGFVNPNNVAVSVTPTARWSTGPQTFDGSTGGTLSVPAYGRISLAVKALAPGIPFNTNVVIQLAKAADKELFATVKVTPNPSMVYLEHAAPSTEAASGFMVPSVRLGAGTNATAGVVNVRNIPTEVVAIITYADAGGTLREYFTPPRMLNRGEHANYNISALVAAGTPDQFGTVLPAGLTEAHVRIFGSAPTLTGYSAQPNFGDGNFGGGGKFCGLGRWRVPNENPFVDVDFVDDDSDCTPVRSALIFPLGFIQTVLFTDCGDIFFANGLWRRWYVRCELDANDTSLCERDLSPDPWLLASSTDPNKLTKKGAYVVWWRSLFSWGNRTWCIAVRRGFKEADPCPDLLCAPTEAPQGPIAANSGHRMRDVGEIRNAFTLNSRGKAATGH